jgi:hypothetical protein
MGLEVSWDGLWILSFGLSQSHGHGSWLVCEVALRTLVSTPQGFYIEIMLLSGEVFGHNQSKLDLSKFNRLHVVIYQFFFIDLMYIIYILFDSCGILPKY